MTFYDSCYPVPRVQKSIFTIPQFFLKTWFLFVLNRIHEPSNFQSKYTSYRPSFHNLHPYGRSSNRVSRRSLVIAGWVHYCHPYLPVYIYSLEPSL